MTTVNERIEFLKNEAEKDQITFSESSLASFQDFRNKNLTLVKPALTLKDNGNIEAIWKNSLGERISIEFLENENVNFTIFHKVGTSIFHHHGNTRNEYIVECANFYWMKDLLFGEDNVV